MLARCGGSVCWAFLKWSELTCAAPASPSRKASTKTYSSGSSTLRDQSNHRQPGSFLHAPVNSAEICGHWSAYSGLILNLAVIKIIQSSVLAELGLAASVPMIPQPRFGLSSDRVSHLR